MDIKEAIQLELDAAGRKPQSMRELNLDNCKANNLDGLTDEFVQLVVLSLNASGLVSLDKFPTFKSLRKLELSDNKISTGLERLVSSTKLTHLNLSNNRIKDLETIKPLSQLVHLRSLDLFSCNVTDVPDYRKKVFEMIPSLKSLDGNDIDDNQVSEEDMTEEEEEEDEDADDGECFIDDAKAADEDEDDDEDEDEQDDEAEDDEYADDGDETPDEDEAQGNSIYDDEDVDGDDSEEDGAGDEKAGSDDDDEDEDEEDDDEELEFGDEDEGAADGMVGFMGHKGKGPAKGKGPGKHPGKGMRSAAEMDDDDDSGGAATPGEPSTPQGNPRKRMRMM